MISYKRAERLIDSGYEVFDASVVEPAEQLGPTVLDIPVVRKFANVFPNEVPCLPPSNEVEFVIDVLTGTVPIS